MTREYVPEIRAAIQNITSETLEKDKRKAIALLDEHSRIMNEKLDMILNNLKPKPRK